MTEVSGPLTYVVEQLWGPPLETGDVRISFDGEAAGWRTAERYLVMPSLDRARMLLPDASRTVPTRSLLNYRGLRKPKANLQRGLLGGATRTGVPLPFPKVGLQVRDGAAPVLPLAMLAKDLGHDEVFASFGVNKNTNRKTTLYVVSRDGDPLGFAKFSWDPASVASVTREGDALEVVGQRTGGARAPAILARGTYYGSPYIVTAPIPLESKGVRADVPAPSPQELFALCPMTRRATLGDTRQFQALRSRLTALTPDAASADVVRQATALLEEIGALADELPVTERWHGDFTPWNSARDSQGVLWCWDWESTEEDTVAGLDAFHWHMTVRTEQGAPWNGATLATAVEAAGPLLRAAGIGPSVCGHLGALYAVVITERAVSWATGAGGWEKGWVLPAQLADLMSAARERMS